MILVSFGFEVVVEELKLLGLDLVVEEREEVVGVEVVLVLVVIRLTKGLGLVLEVLEVLEVVLVLEVIGCVLVVFVLLDFFIIKFSFGDFNFLVIILKLGLIEIIFKLVYSYVIVISIISINDIVFKNVLNFFLIINNGNISKSVRYSLLF